LPSNTPGTIPPTSTTRFGAWNWSRLRGSALACNVDDFALTPAERSLLQALNARGIRYLLIGLGAAVLEGAPLATQDLDLWLERADHPQIATAAAEAGGFWISGFGVQPPAFGGPGLERLDVVLTAHGLDSFETEYSRGVVRHIEGVQLHVLPLERVIASKRATRRPKDLAALPALEAALLARRADQSPE
jgi:hypothetical protein